MVLLNSSPNPAVDISSALSKRPIDGPLAENNDNKINSKNFMMIIMVVVVSSSPPPPILFFACLLSSSPILDVLEILISVEHFS